VDHDIGVKPECDDEKAGAGSQLAAKADEGGTVFIDQLTGSGRKTFTSSYHPANEKSSVVRVIG
jgi:hypothetical protein